MMYAVSAFWLSLESDCGRVTSGEGYSISHSLSPTELDHPQESLWLTDTVFRLNFMYSIDLLYHVYML